MPSLQCYSSILTGTLNSSLSSVVFENKYENSCPSWKPILNKVIGKDTLVRQGMDTLVRQGMDTLENLQHLHPYFEEVLFILIEFRLSNLLSQILVLVRLVSFEYKL